MHFLRTSSTLARLILAWFVLALGVAIASPVVHPRAMELVCSVGSTAKLVAIGEDGQDSTALHATLDCPLCLAAHAPPPVATIAFASQHPLTHALQPVAAAHIAALVGAPLPARGPPISA